MARKNNYYFSYKGRKLFSINKIDKFMSYVKEDMLGTPEEYESAEDFYEKEELIERTIKQKFFYTKTPVFLVYVNGKPWTYKSFAAAKATAKLAANAKVWQECCLI